MKNFFDRIKYLYSNFSHRVDNCFGGFVGSINLTSMRRFLLLRYVKLLNTVLLNSFDSSSMGTLRHFSVSRLLDRRKFERSLKPWAKFTDIIYARHIQEKSVPGSRYSKYSERQHKSPRTPPPQASGTLTQNIAHVLVWDSYLSSCTLHELF